MVSGYIHNTAVVSEGAKIGAGVKIGPFCVVGENVILKDNVELKSHVCVDGITEIGEGTVVYPFASIGQIPQDLKYHGEDSRIRIGKNNSIREYVTVHPGTSGGRMETVIGDECLLMAGAHVAHDCVLKNHVIMANNATIGGHVVLEDYVIIGGLAAIHQFVRIGEHAMIGGMCGITNDIVPYAICSAKRADISGINVVGLRRRGFSNEQISHIRRAFDIIFLKDGDGFLDKLDKLESELGQKEHIGKILSFMKDKSDRKFCTTFEKSNGSLA